MARPNSPDMPPKRTKNVRLGIIIVVYSILLLTKTRRTRQHFFLSSHLKIKCYSGEPPEVSTVSGGEKAVVTVYSQTDATTLSENLP